MVGPALPVPPSEPRTVWTWVPTGRRQMWCWIGHCDATLQGVIRLLATKAFFGVAFGRFKFYFAVRLGDFVVRRRPFAKFTAGAEARFVFRFGRTRIGR